MYFSDTICELGGTSELANYGEYSGAPSEQQTYDYARTILSLMTRHRSPNGKKLIIGGGIANFTNVAATFKGIVRALNEYKIDLQEHNTHIYVRRGGPNYQEGLRVMKEQGDILGVPLHVFGPETHMTAIVGMALGTRPIEEKSKSSKKTTANFLLGVGQILIHLCYKMIFPVNKTFLSKLFDMYICIYIMIIFIYNMAGRF